MEFLRLFLTGHFEGNSAVATLNVGCFLRLVSSLLIMTPSILFSLNRNCRGSLVSGIGKLILLDKNLTLTPLLLKAALTVEPVHNGHCEDELSFGWPLDVRVRCNRL